MCRSVGSAAGRYAYGCLAQLRAERAGESSSSIWMLERYSRVSDSYCLFALYKGYRRWLFSYDQKPFVTSCIPPSSRSVRS